MRHLSIGLLALSLFSLALGQDTSLAEVKKAFDDANIPADEHFTFNPSILFQVTFPEPESAPVPLKAGIHLNRNQTAIPPTFSLPLAPSTFGRLISSPTSSPLFQTTFVVAMVDPDAPTPQDPTNAQIRHFLGGNFHLDLFTGFGKGPLPQVTLKNSTPAVSDFRQPTPPAGSDPHRYTFLLFAQPSDFNTRTPLFVNASTSISNFNISQFAQEVGLGEPLGGTFMLVGPDANSTAAA